MGAALATTLGSVIVNALRLLQVHWLVEVWPWDLAFVKPLVAGLVAMGAGLLLRRLLPPEGHLLYLLVDVAVLWLAYAVATMLLGLTAEDRFVLSRTRDRFRRVWA